MNEISYQELFEIIDNYIGNKGPIDGIIDILDATAEAVIMTISHLEENWQDYRTAEFYENIYSGKFINSVAI